MKKIFLFLVLSVFSRGVLAQDNAQATILRDIIQGNVEKSSKEDDGQNKDQKGGHGGMHNLTQSNTILSSRLITDINYDDNYQTTNRKDEYTDAYAHLHLFSTLNLTHNFFAKTSLKFTRVHQVSEAKRRNASPTGGGDRTFENHGAYIEEAALGYENKKLLLLAGKFNANFGTAWRRDRGIWAYVMAQQNYKLKEKLGLSAMYRFGNVKKTGLYEFGISTFTNDRKNLDNSIITGRDSAHKYNGLPGDTRSLKSYVASLDISFDFGPKEKLSYHFAYADLAVNAQASTVTPTKIDDQKGYVAGMRYVYPIKENFSVDGLLEYARMKNVGGNSDIGDQYFTFNLINRISQNWNITLAYDKRDESYIDQAGYQEDFVEVSGGYELGPTAFYDKLLLQVGYKNQRNDYKTSLETKNSWGALFRYIKSF